MASRDSFPAHSAVLCGSQALVTGPVDERARSFLVWMLARRDARRGQLAVDWPELAS
ncbi:hypothetical protein [Novosphingobium lindaniclasticum]|uniref:hypothetical protein n=1 Tax=Novosphingobium lindaniclasticum TaxID=1329895 RepID=UPI0004028F8D|nr:hypothetical protein [Novosphingobium lindaniclasticum]